MGLTAKIAAALLVCAAAGTMSNGASAKRRLASGPLTRLDIESACAHAASMRPEEALTRTVRSGTFDIDGDGKLETVTGTAAMGTMGGDAFEIRDASGKPVTWEEVDVRHGSDILLGARWMRFRRRAYLLGLDDEDAKFLVRLSYPGADRKLHWGCHFRTRIAEAFRPVGRDRDSKRICDAVGSGRAVEIPVSAMTDGPEAGTWTHVNGSVDIDLNGRTTPLRRLNHSSMSGRGCDATFFDTESAADRAHGALMDMQHVTKDEEGYWPGVGECGGLARRWLRINGRAYLETRYPRATPEAGSQLVHRLDTIIEGKPKPVCNAVFTRTWVRDPEGDRDAAHRD